ncbi:hypothetical protein [uncultured Paenibacillus sp.]|uniref:hypothetical protein n=1 Tax=uncultured Paenibacillus sp. TaxID=227322 RepID=UPI0015B1304D|nr:hypothetical protein [uncultured Paenibacillus sp.]
MNWAEQIAHNMTSHDKYCEEVSSTLKECLFELKKLGLMVNYEFLSLHPLEWKVTINNKEVVMKGNDIYDYQRRYDERHNPIDHSGDLKEAVQRFLLDRFHETY